MQIQMLKQMKNTFWFFSILTFLLMGCQSGYKTTGEIIRNDEAINAIIPADAQLEIIAKGFDWSEGPLWVEEHQMLLFSDIPPNSIYKWTESGGKSLYLKPSGYTGEKARGGEPGSNGLLLNAEGQLVLCQHGDRRMAIMDAPLDQPEAKFKTIIDQFAGRRLNSPNDAVYDSNGYLFFTDPPYGLEGNMDDPEKEIPFQGVYRLSPNGDMEALSNTMSRPNGIALSPDERQLYVANSDPDRAFWRIFTLDESRNIIRQRELFDATSSVGPENPGLPDGMKVDDNGNIFATGPGGVWVFTPQGKHLGTIRTGQATSNCAFNADKSVLYITADMYLMRLKLK